MNFIIDMNLSPRWTDVLEAQGWTARHWASVGDPKAPDQTIFSWAAENGYIVLTRDLDFGALLALARSTEPSVLQIRAREVSPFVIGRAVVEAILSATDVLGTGGIVTVEPGRTRVRHLPIG